MKQSSAKFPEKHQEIYLHSETLQLGRPIPNPRIRKHGRQRVRLPGARLAHDAFPKTFSPSFDLPYRSPASRPESTPHLSLDSTQHKTKSVPSTQHKQVLFCEFSSSFFLCHTTLVIIIFSRLILWFLLFTLIYDEAVILICFL